MKSIIKIMRNYFGNKLQIYPVDSYSLRAISNETNLGDVPKTPFTEFAKPKSNCVIKFINSWTENQLYLLYPASPFTCILPEACYKVLLQKLENTRFYNTTNNKICDRLRVWTVFFLFPAACFPGLPLSQGDLSGMPCACLKVFP